MTNIIQHIFRGILSVVTTFVLMAAPIAAIVYSSDSVQQVEYDTSPAEIASPQTKPNANGQVWTMRQEANGKTVAMAIK